MKHRGDRNRRALPTFRLELPLDPRWRSIDVMHRTIVNCTESILADAALTSMLGMIASELIENAVKYADWSQTGKASILVRPRPTQSGDVIEIEVTSPLADEADYEELQRVLAWVRSFPSPRDAYLTRLREILDEEPLGRSRLGLTRIAYEGCCELDAQLSARDRLVHVRATLPCSVVVSAA